MFDRAASRAYPTALQNLAVMNVPYVGMKAAITLNPALTPRAESRVLRRPILSAKFPHRVAPTIIPTNVIAPIIIIIKRVIQFFKVRKTRGLIKTPACLLQVFIFNYLQNPIKLNLGLKNLKL